MITLFRLSPITEHLDHPDWARSTYKGVCHVAADDEHKARRFVEMEFGIATGKDPGADVPTSPWLNPDLTECVTAASLGDEPPLGMVTIPTELGFVY